MPPSSAPALRHPRGRLAPPLPADAPIWARLARATRRLGHGLVLHDAFSTAPAMAFHFFLSLMPLFVFVGYVVGSIAKKRGVNAVLSPVLDNLPESAEVVVKGEVLRLAGADALGPIALVGFLWIASGGTHGLMHAMETVVGAPRRRWWEKRAIALGWVLSACVLFAGAAFAVIQWDRVVHPPEPVMDLPSATPSLSPSHGGASGQRADQPGNHEHGTLKTGTATRGDGTGVTIPHASSTDPMLGTSSASGAKASRSERSSRRRRIVRSSGERALGLGLSITFATVVLAVFYRLAVSHSKRVARRVLPGALLAVVLWLLVSWAFGLYVKSLAEYAVYYGSLAAVAVLLVWLWLTSLAILIGAELNSQLEGLRD